MIRRHLQTLATLAAPITMPVWRLTGRWLGSAEPAELLVAGSAGTTAFLAGALLQAGRRTLVTRLPSPFALRSARFEQLCSGAGLVAVEVPPLWKLLLPAGIEFRIPAWISQELRPGRDGVLALPAAIGREVARHRRRASYAVAFSRAVTDIRRFYAGMYRPYVTARFGAGRVVVAEQRFLAVGRGQTLATLTESGRPVAGLLFSEQGDSLQLGWFGAASNPPPPGASEVLDAEVIGAAIRKGVRRVVLGHSRPSLADGVVRYKARFGAVVRSTRFPQHVIGLQVRSPAPALASAINAARLVCPGGGQLRIWTVNRAPIPAAGSPEHVPST